MLLFPSAGRPLLSEINGELNLAILGDRLLCDILEKGEDFLMNTITLRGPLNSAKENSGAFAQLRKMKFLGSSTLQVVNFLL